ncbi:serine/threonine protein kinase [Acidovorax sp. GBBC 3334]|uniref:serine/threonine protein kinase n=1 Tax=Acidovorax sp. GBBC 3334 TaxID=2940496 RepID=UPI00230225A8|nr:serine/threonine-protein kinase [Acidovorax sp. GBBC 3334]MDA8453565.1 serine/threonine protein kinase [Acidovorax sp. GBBC 3334]
MSAPSLVTEPPGDVHHVDALSAGARLGEFEVVSLLGVGGFGMVYKAFDHSLLRFVAIKEYMPTALAARAQGQSLWVRSSSHEQSFQAGLASFVAEARLLAQFDHPSLVKVFRFWEANQTAYMVMPLYTGMTLKQARAHMRTPPPEAWLRKVLWSVLGALRVLHDGQTLHRDISPDNIFLQDSGPPVLLDLGAARHAITDHSHRLTAVLKVNYAPIEQYNDEGNDLRQGPWSDLYSVGAVMHGCLCNDTPLPATLRAIRDRMVPFSRVAKTVRRQFGVDYSAPFVAGISQALALQPEERPQSIDEFLRAIDMTVPPEGMEQFDFRAELGDIWVEPADRRGAGVAVPMIDITSVPAPMSGVSMPAPMAAVLSTPAPAAAVVARRSAEPPAAPAHAQDTGGDTVFLDSAVDAGDSVFEPTVVHGAPRPAASDAQEGGPRQRAPGKWPRAWFAAAALALLAVAAGGAVWMQQPEAKPVAAPRTPEEEIIVETAEPVPAAGAPSDAASDAAVAAVDGAQPAGPAPAASSPVSVPPGLALAAASTPRARPPARKASEPGVAAAAAPSAPAAPAEAAAPVAAARPAPRVAGPDEACADAGFLAKPMCIHQECQHPAVANHPLCVENRRRLEAEERRRLMLSQ